MLAGIGAIALLVATVTGHWFEPIKSFWATSYGSAVDQIGDVSTARFHLDEIVGLGAPTTIVLVLAILAGISTAGSAIAVASGDDGPRRGFSPAAAYALAALGLIVLFVRLFVVQPGLEVAQLAATAVSSMAVTAELHVSTMGYVGLAGAVLIVLGTGLELRADRASRKTSEAAARAGSEDGGEPGAAADA